MNKILINGVECTQIDVRDRGFQYGDGLFETIAYKNNQLQLWDEHIQRMQNGCERLSLKFIESTVWREDIEKLDLSTDAVIKISISRGISGRGYVYNSEDAPTRVVAVYDWPDYLKENRQGIIATLCKTPVSVNPTLAGIKHLNRLDNVLARNEWRDSAIAEGFMFDNDGHIIEGTMSNVFCILGDELYTPELSQCGVAGIMRQQVIKLAEDNDIAVNIVNISKQNFLQMDAVFITNSLIGIWPVNQIDNIRFQNNELLNILQSKL